MIDFHTYPVMIKEILEKNPDQVHAVKDIFGFGFPSQPLVLFLMEMEEAGIEKAVLLPIDCTSRHNCKIISNESVAELCDAHPEFIGFASVDPSLDTACKDLEQSIKQLGLCGLKLDPALQGFFIDDKQKAYPVYETCQALGIPMIVDCGLNWAPSALSKYAQPAMLDEVAFTFPDLSIVIAHTGWPWIDEALMVAIKHPNVYLDTAILYSGTPSDAFHKVYADHIGLEVLERSLRNKIIFGSNYPRVDIRRSVKGIYDLNLSSALEKNIFNNNACRILKL